jgi:hypothetical protein
MAVAGRHPEGHSRDAGIPVLMAITPKDIWDALESAGASAVQAAGIMGNMIHESSLNPESAATDSNGYMSYGLAQWNAQDYPDAGRLVTGNAAADLKAQIDYLTQTGGLQAAAGTTVSETASGFAANYERCQGCAAGGAQNAARVASAATVAGWAAGGDWPSTSGSATDTATLTAAQEAQAGTAQAACAWSIGWGGIPDTSWLQTLFSLGQAGGNVGSGEVCVLSKSQARAIAGTLLALSGAIIMGVGAGWAIKASAIAEAAKIAGPVLRKTVPGALAAEAAPVP